LSSAQSLCDLAADARAQISDPPSWDHVVDEATRLRLGAAHADAAVMAGLMSDVVRMKSVDNWPADVNESLHHLGLFDKYSPTTLHGVLAHLSSRQVGGLTNSVKGAMLELHTVDAMNHGDIPMTQGATHAELTRPLNHPGVDIHEIAADGHIVESVQVKATAHWQVIAHHLSCYPQYPNVATTHEGAQEALRHGLDHQHVIDTGVHAHALTDAVASHLQHLDVAHALHEFVPEIAIVAILAVAALKLRNGDGGQETAAWVKEQITLAGLANSAGLAVQLLTGTGALRPLAAIGTRFIAARGSVARRTGSALRRVGATLRELRNSCEAHGYGSWSAASAR
jgi:hypothetical protein